MFLAACGAPTPGPADSGVVDSGTPDAGPRDGGHDVVDAGPWDGGFVQLNDVSILYPLPMGQQKLLSVSASGARGTLLPESRYTAMGPLAGSSGNPPVGGIGEALYSDLFVVGVRVDPCFADLSLDPHAANCENQLRLVVQEVTMMNDAGGSFDSALHLFYRITRAEAVEFARAVAQLRRASSSGEALGSLAVHPVMRREGVGGAFDQGLRALVLRLAGDQNLFRITRLAATNPGFGWKFDGIEIAASQWRDMVIPSFDGGVNAQELFTGFGGVPDAIFMPETLSTDNLGDIAHKDRAQQATATQRATAFSALVHVNHPGRHSPNTIDCASCHMATPASKLLAFDVYGMNEATHPDAFRPSGFGVTTADLNANYVTTGGFNLHAFSYFGDDPGINQRTVNETAAVVQFINQVP